jgi:hypothetical protein
MEQSNLGKDIVFSNIGCDYLVTVVRQPVNNCEVHYISFIYMFKTRSAKLLVCMQVCHIQIWISMHIQVDT